MPSAQTMLDAYWQQSESGKTQPLGEGMRIKRIMIALAAMIAMTDK